MVTEIQTRMLILKSKIFTRLLDSSAGRFLQAVMMDFKDTGKDCVKFTKEHPNRSSVYGLALSFIGYMTYTNPSKTSFDDSLVSAANDIMLVSQQCRNRKSVNDISRMKELLHENALRRVSLGPFSLMIRKNVPDDCCLMKYRCYWLTSIWVSKLDIVDVGFLNRWWYLEESIKDYDINYSSFSE